MVRKDAVRRDMAVSGNPTARVSKAGTQGHGTHRGTHGIRGLRGAGERDLGVVNLQALTSEGTGRGVTCCLICHSQTVAGDTMCACSISSRSAVI